MPAPVSPPRVLTLILLTAASTLSLNMFLPSLPRIAADLNVDYAVASFALSGYLAVTAAILLVLGPVSDRFGRRPVLLAALAVFTAASMICALTDDIHVFLAFRMAQGAMAGGAALSMAIVRDTRPQREAAGLIGYIAMCMAAAPMLGPMAGGVIDAAFGWRAVFWIYAGLGAILFALCWVDLGETRRGRSAEADQRPEASRSLMREPRFWAYAFCTASSRGAFYVFVAGVPFVAASAFRAESAEIGIYVGSITAGFLTGAFISGRLASTAAPLSMMLAGRAIACAGLLAGLGLALAGFLHPVLFVAPAVMAGLGNGVTIPSSSAATMSVRPDLAGSAAGLEGAVTVAGGAVLTLLTGILLSPENAPVVLLLLMLAVSAAAVPAVLLAARLEKTEGEAEGS